MAICTPSQESGEKGLLELVMATHAGMTTAEFEQMVGRDWITTLAKHPSTFHRFRILKCVFQPMLELLDYLRANGFKTYIVSGGGIELMRVFAEEVYGIPPEQVDRQRASRPRSRCATASRTRHQATCPRSNFIDDKAGKPVGINKFIGRRPIAAFGNSDGDLQMLQWTAAGDGLRFCLYVHHTDAQREWAYDRESHIGKLDKGLDEAHRKGWTVVDMKKDWKVVYPFHLE